MSWRGESPWPKDLRGEMRCPCEGRRDHGWDEGLTELQSHRPSGRRHGGSRLRRRTRSRSRSRTTRSQRRRSRRRRRHDRSRGDSWRGWSSSRRSRERRHRHRGSRDRTRRRSEGDRHRHRGRDHRRHRSARRHRSGSQRSSFALAANVHPRTRLPCGLTAGEVYDLLSREITPNDYELLLRLDKAVAKPVASNESIEALPDVPPKAFMGGECAICLTPFQADSKVAAMACKHHFHRSCITKWLSECRKTCPLCGKEDHPL
mmetsp:Transcript_27095/g.48981  ORF Transcript_27095/g.48981 Transcript_27095/m.48981 type:complete len:261 (-) Transcript_27095:129-911(-)